MPAAASRLRILCVGGLDPCGGAGLSADARMAAALGAEAATVCTSLTLQNRHGFTGQQAVDLGLLRDSLQMVRDDAPLQALKFGLMPGPAQLELCLDFVAQHFAGLPLVVDPVLGATAGGLAPAADLAAAYRAGMGLVDLCKPNQAELTLLGGEPEALLAAGCAGVLVSDGDGEAAQVVDRLYQTSGLLELRHPRLATGPVHGTGCGFSTALALARGAGKDREQASRLAVAILGNCLQVTESNGLGLPVPLGLPDLAGFRRQICKVLP